MWALPRYAYSYFFCGIYGSVHSTGFILSPNLSFATSTDGERRAVYDTNDLATMPEGYSDIAVIACVAHWNGWVEPAILEKVTFNMIRYLPSTAECVVD